MWQDLSPDLLTELRYFFLLHGSQLILFFDQSFSCFIFQDSFTYNVYKYLVITGIYLAGTVSFRPRYLAFSWWQEFKFISSARGQPNGLMSISLIVSLPTPCCPSLSVVIAWAGYLPAFPAASLLYCSWIFSWVSGHLSCLSGTIQEASEESVS